MMERAAVLELQLSFEVDQREDRWAFWSHEFGFFAYGHTREEAEAAFRESLMELLNSFESDSELRDYLDGKGIYHRFSRGGHPSLPETGRFERQFEVPLGATP